MLLFIPYIMVKINIPLRTKHKKEKGGLSAETFEDAVPGKSHLTSYEV
jgi:hypothetical protein